MNSRIRIALSTLVLLMVGAIIYALSVSASLWQPLPVHSDTAAAFPEMRNVIVLIPDGCSQSMVTLARWTRGRPLAVDAIQTGAVKTHSASSLVTDSAAAATALATGVKTVNRMLGLAPPLDAPFRLSDLPYAPYQPLATVLEGARHSGRAVGLVVTVCVWDATPAGFVAHTLSHQADDELLEQMLHQHLDVVLGGGRNRFLPIAAGGTRTDGRNLIDLLRTQGVQVVQDASALAHVSTGKVWGLFAPNNLSAELDRAALTQEQPSLAQMTAKAIQLLKRNPRGFFLMVEGSQVDNADHINDPAKAVQEFLAFDEAVAEALKFATGEGQDHTLVMACPDHDTGGMSIGQRDKTPQTLADLTAPLAGMQVSADTLAAKIGADRSPANIMANVDAWWNIRLSPTVAAEMTNSVAGGLSLECALAASVSRHYTAIGWTSFDHTGVDVPLWSYGPGHPVGVIDNTDVARITAQALRLDLPALTRALYVDAQKTFPDATVDISDPANPMLVIGAARLPINQSVLLLNGKEHRLNGVVVHIEKTGHTYIPQQAVDLVRAYTSMRCAVVIPKKP